MPRSLTVNIGRSVSGFAYSVNLNDETGLVASHPAQGLILGLNWTVDLVDAAGVYGNQLYNLTTAPTTYTTSPGETVGISDGTQSQRFFAAGVEDLGLSDAVSYVRTGSNIDYTRSVSDGLALTEAVSASKGGAQPLFAGHIPNRVIVGMAGPESDNPNFDDGRVLIQNASQAQLGFPGVGSYERRRFSPSAPTTASSVVSTLRGMCTDGDTDGVYNWVSFRADGNWANIAAGNAPGPAIVQGIKQYDAERRAQGRGPWMCTINHEPRGDGVLTDWSAMHIWLSNQLADINDNLAWSCIGNGFLWNNVTGSSSVQADRAGTFPQALIDTFRTNKHVVAVDTYDDHPTYTGQETYPVGGQNNRCSVKLTNWINWMRARNCGALGIGEWSVTDVGEMPKVWTVMRNNRDKLGVTNYFNSIGGGSSWDWRLIPANYPAQGISGGVDYGGTALTEGRLNYFPTILYESANVYI